MQVLVADDDRSVREALVQILQRRGHEVSQSASGEEALAAWRKSAFPLLLLDLLMPGTSGLDVCRTIRQMPGGADVVIVVVTACDRQDDLQAVLEAGASDYLTKPIDFHLLEVRLAIAERHVEAVEARRHVEAQLRETHDRLELASRGANDGLWEGRADEQGNWKSPQTRVWYSPRFKEILGYRDDEFPDMLGSWLSHLHPDDYGAATAALEDHLESRLPFDATYRVRTKSGSYRWIRGIGQATWDEQGRPVRMAGSMRDVTGRVRLDHFRMGQLRMFEKLLRGASVEDLMDTLADTVESQFDDAHCVISVAPSPGRTPYLAAPSLSGEQIEALDRVFRSKDHRSADARPEQLAQGCVVAGLTVVARVPLAAGGDECFGCVNILMREPRGLLTSQLDLLEIVAHLAAGVVQRRNTEHALRASEERWRSLVASAPDIILIVDAQRRIQFINQVLPGYSRAQVLGQDVLHYVSEKYRRPLREALEQVFATGQSSNLELAGAGADGATAWYATRLGPIREGGRVTRATLITTDISNRRQMEQNLREEQQLLKQLLDLHERDRKVIAYEIHDGLVQDMTGAQMHLEAYREFRQSDFKKAEENLQRAMNLMRASVAEGRRLINGLRPPILDELGIVAAIEHLVEETRREISRVDFRHDLDQAEAAPPLENAVFRIVQEALANVRHHSGADRVRVELDQIGDRLRIEVRDWGVGFDPDKTPGERFGLRGVRERTRLLGGIMSIRSAPGKGTRIVVDLPMYPSTPSIY